MYICMCMCMYRVLSVLSVLSVLLGHSYMTVCAYRIVCWRIQTDSHQKSSIVSSRHYMHLVDAASALHTIASNSLHIVPWDALERSVQTRETVL